MDHEEADADQANAASADPAAETPNRRAAQQAPSPPQSVCSTRLADVGRLGRQQAVEDQVGRVVDPHLALAEPGKPVAPEVVPDGAGPRGATRESTAIRPRKNWVTSPPTGICRRRRSARARRASPPASARTASEPRRRPVTSDPTRFTRGLPSSRHSVSAHAGASHATGSWLFRRLVRLKEILTNRVHDFTRRTRSVGRFTGTGIRSLSRFGSTLLVLIWIDSCSRSSLGMGGAFRITATIDRIDAR